MGAGSWGTALGVLLARKGHVVTLWSHDPDVARGITAERRTPYLPDVVVPETVHVSTDPEHAVAGAALVVSVSPSQFVRDVMTRAAPAISEDATLVSASKGIELGTLRRMDEVLTEILPAPLMDRFTVLSGPSFAGEVAREMPTAVVVAGRSEEAAVTVQHAFQTPYFRVYTNTDVVGVELGGAVKNVIALAAGVAAGLGFGHNTSAALMTRGLAEITRLGLAMGARRETFSGLAGMGDLVLTCTGSLSRNRTVGYRLGRGERLEDILQDMSSVAEGVRTSEAVFALARRHGVEMPITEEVYAIVHDGRDPAAALSALMHRDPKPEDWS
ncbi:MAG: NAD(P)H-dependent glycerol-3-phosphate dehydrogenase [Gemmatimonadota bacterium]|nr:NAD(P)H-dependent glycerol-3-phosphate dehydrogenase [Gemmatimonadota bacterium]